MLFASSAPPLPPVSYHREVAAIFAMHCNGCHGDVGHLSLRSYADVMRGGNLGRIVIPGNADGSLLIHFLDGRRGEAHRMPREGRPLSPSQMDVIRRWINEGARQDDTATPAQVHTRPNTVVSRDAITRISCRVNTPAYLVVSALDPRSGRVLWSDVASVKLPKEGNDAGEPGQLISWDIRAAEGWPPSVTIELRIEHARTVPRDVELTTRSGLKE